MPSAAAPAAPATAHDDSGHEQDATVDEGVGSPRGSAEKRCTTFSSEAIGEDDDDDDDDEDDEDDDDDDGAATKTQTNPKTMTAAATDSVSFTRML